MRRIAVVGSLAAVLIAAGSRSQAPEVRSAMGLAVRMKDEDPEQAAALLRRAWLLCEGLDDRERRSLQGQVTDLLRDVDRHGIRLVRTQKRMIDDLREHAATYSAASWIQTAEQLLRAAEALLPEAVADDLRALERRRAEIEQTTPDVPAGSNSQLLNWFRGAGSAQQQGWKITRSGVFSPRLERAKTQTLFAERPFVGDGRIRVHVRFGPGGKAGLAWCHDERGGDAYFVLEIEDRDEVLGARLHYCENDRVRTLKSRDEARTRQEILDWHLLEIVITGQIVTCYVDDRTKPIQVLLDRHNSGRIGFFVSGDSVFRDPVHYRNLSVERFAPVQ